MSGLPQKIQLTGLMVFLLWALSGCSHKQLPSTNPEPQATPKTVVPYRPPIKANGQVKDVYQGQLLAEGSFKDSLKTGTWKYYDEKGALHLVVNYQKGVYHGAFQRFANGKKVYQCQYESGRMVDTAKAWWDNGTLAFEKSYANDLLNGDCIYYYADGTKNHALKFKNGQLDGDIYRFHANGHMATKETFKNGEKNGLFIDYYENQKMVNIRHYTDGRIDSVFKQYFANGLKDESYQLKNGNGLVKTYYGNGQLRSIESYKDGYYHGKQQYFYSNGQVHRTIHTLNGLADGLVLEYELSGKLVLEGRAEKGFKSGTWKTPTNNIEISHDYVLTDSVKYLWHPSVLPSFSETPARPVIGMNKIRSLLLKRIQLPKIDDATPLGSGMFYIQFTIEKDGSMSDIHLMPGTEVNNSSYLNQFVLKAFTNLPNWMPKTSAQEPISSEFTFPMRVEIR